MRRGVVLVAAGAAIVVAAFGVARLWRGPSRLPSIIVIVVDTLRADHLGCYGYFRDTTPQIDAFARDALLFENAMTPIGITLPAHVSLFSSTNPPRHGVHGNFSRFRVPVPTGDDFRLMAQMLSRLGYATAGFVSSPAVNKETGLSAGFDTYTEAEEHAGANRAADTTDRVLAWLGRIDESRPFFLFVHYVDPHSPYNPPEPYDSMFGTDEAQRNFLSRRGVPLNRKNLEANNAYDGEVRYADTHIGRLLARLRETGLLERAAVVLTADHGEGLGQHRWLYHARIYNEQMRVPLIMRLPGRDDLRGGRFGEVVSLIDVLPILAENLGLPLTSAEKAQFEGINVLGNTGRQYVFADRVKHQMGDPDGQEYYALASLEWKFFLRQQGRDLLFDMTADPAETENLVQARPEVAGAMRELLQGLVDGYQRTNARLETDADLPESAKDRLRQLGYAE